MFAPDRISAQAWQASFTQRPARPTRATCASLPGSPTSARISRRSTCPRSWCGTQERILPIAATADWLPDLIADVRLVRVEGGAHNIGWTHPEEVSRALLEFLDEPHGASRTDETAAAGHDRLPLTRASAPRRLHARSMSPLIRTERLLTGTSMRRRRMARGAIRSGCSPSVDATQIGCATSRRTLAVASSCSAGGRPGGGRERARSSMTTIHMSVAESSTWASHVVASA
jgi:hypothetical protein